MTGNVLVEFENFLGRKPECCSLVKPKQSSHVWHGVLQIQAASCHQNLSQINVHANINDGPVPQVLHSHACARRVQMVWGEACCRQCPHGNDQHTIQTSQHTQRKGNLLYKLVMPVCDCAGGVLAGWWGLRWVRPCVMLGWRLWS